MRRACASIGVLALALAGCIGPAQTPVPSVTVHLRNLTSNVVVSSINLHPDGVIGTPPVDGYGFVAPCGGEVELRTPISHGVGGGLGLAIDPTGQLDRMYPDVQPDDPFQLQVEIIWSSGELQDGDWVTVTSTEVIRGTDPYSPPSPPRCAPWAHMLESFTRV